MIIRALRRICIIHCKSKKFSKARQFFAQLLLHFLGLKGGWFAKRIRELPGQSVLVVETDSAFQGVGGVSARLGERLDLVGYLLPDGGVV